MKTTFARLEHVKSFTLTRIILCFPPITNATSAMCWNCYLQLWVRIHVDRGRDPSIKTRATNTTQVLQSVFKLVEHNAKYRAWIERGRANTKTFNPDEQYILGGFTFEKETTHQEKEFTNACQRQEENEHLARNAIFVSDDSDDDTNQVRPRTPPTEPPPPPPPPMEGHLPRASSPPTSLTQSPHTCVAPTSGREKPTPLPTHPPLPSATNIDDEYDDDAEAHNETINTNDELEKAEQRKKKRSKAGQRAYQKAKRAFEEGNEELSN